MRKFLVLSAIVLLTAIPASAAYHYKAITETDGEGGEAGSFEVEAWVDGPRAKVLFTESGNPLMEAGSYLLTQDGGKVVYLVNPEEKTYSEWDLEALLSNVGSMMESMGGMMKMEVTEHEVEKLLEEDGGSMHGYPTTHYRYRTAYTLSMKVMGMQRANRMETIQDIWSTTAIDDEGFYIWLRNAPRSTGFEGFDELIEAEYSKINGFPLKSKGTTVTTGGKKGRTSTSTSTTEVTLLEKTSVAGSTFDLDPTFTEVQMMPTPGMMPPPAADDEPAEEDGGRFKKWKKKLGG